MSSALSVQLGYDDLTREAIEKIVDQDIEQFQKYFCNELKNERLSMVEIAILKTYLHYKLFGPKEPA